MGPVESWEKSSTYEADLKFLQQQELIELLDSSTPSVSAFPLENVRQMLLEVYASQTEDFWENRKAIEKEIEEHSSNKTIFPGGSLEISIDNSPCTIRLSPQGEISFLYKNKIIKVERVRVGNVGSYEIAADIIPSWMITNKTKRRQLEKLKEIKTVGLPARGITSLTQTSQGISIWYKYMPCEHDPIQTPIIYNIPLGITSVGEIVKKSIAGEKVEIFRDNFVSAIQYLQNLPDEQFSPWYKEFIGDYLNSIILHTQVSPAK